MYELERVEAAIKGLEERKPAPPNENLRDYAAAALVGGLMLMVQDGQWSAAIIGAGFAVYMLSKYITARHTFERWSWDMGCLSHRRRLIVEAAPETLALELAAFDEQVGPMDASRRAREAKPLTRLLLRVSNHLATRYAVFG